jgi:hypothetical protein
MVAAGVSNNSTSSTNIKLSILYLSSDTVNFRRWTRATFIFKRYPVKPHGGRDRVLTSDITGAVELFIPQHA